MSDYASDYGRLTTMIQPDGEAEQLSLDYWEKANDYHWIVSDYQATIVKKTERLLNDYRLCPARKR